MERHWFDKQGTTGRISLPQRFDMMSTIDLRIPFAKVLGDTARQRLVVDLSRLRYIDSMGIGTLIAWGRTCRNGGKAMVLEHCDPSIRKLLKLVGVAGLFEFVRPAG